MPRATFFIRSLSDMKPSGESYYYKAEPWLMLWLSMPVVSMEGFFIRGFQAKEAQELPEHPWHTYHVSFVYWGPLWPYWMLVMTEWIVLYQANTKPRVGELCSFTRCQIFTTVKEWRSYSRFVNVNLCTKVNLSFRSFRVES